jgi:hypothetical protein
MSREQGSMMSEAKSGMRPAANAALASHSRTCASPLRDAHRGPCLLLGEAA